MLKYIYFLFFVQLIIERGIDASATPTRAPTFVPTSYACPTGYSALAVGSSPAICIQSVTHTSSVTQASFDSLCSSSYNGGNLVTITNADTRDALLSYVSALKVAGSWSNDREFWVGVQLTSSSSVSTKKAFSPYGSAQTNANNVTSIFTPFATTTYWISNSEPATGDVAVTIMFKNSNSYIKFKGRTSSNTNMYGIW